MEDTANPLEELMDMAGGTQGLANATGVSSHLIFLLRRGAVADPAKFVRGLNAAGVDGAGWLERYTAWRERRLAESRGALAAAYHPELAAIARARTA